MAIKALTVFGGALLLLVGCSTQRALVLNQTVGPNEVAGGFVSRGYLEVFSATQEYNDAWIFYYPHTSYDILSADGRFLKTVPNHMGKDDEAPMRVVLPAGKYRVVARAEGYGLVNVPVIIYGGKKTALYLQRNAMAEAAGKADRDLVRLPGGYVVGWRAKEEPGKK